MIRDGKQVKLFNEQGAVIVGSDENNSMRLDTESGILD